MNYMWVIYIPFYFTLSSHAVTSVMSDSVRPHRRQPTRLLHPWDPPGESTGVACHFLLRCMKGKVKLKSLSCVWLFATPWTAAHQAPPSMGFSRRSTGVDCHINFFFQRLDGILSSYHIPFEWRLNCFIWCIPLVVHIFKVLLTTWEFDFSYLLHHWTI